MENNYKEKEDDGFRIDPYSGSWVKEKIVQKIKKYHSKLKEKSQKIAENINPENIACFF